MNTLKKHLNSWNAQTEYCAEYEHEGGSWCLNFFAVDEEDALKKIESIKNSLKFNGQLEETIATSLDDVPENSPLAALIQGQKPI